MFIKRRGGMAAWLEGYHNAPPALFVDYDDWFLESYGDGRRHALDDGAAAKFRESKKAQTKAIRAKFKQIREANKK